MTDARAAVVAKLGVGPLTGGDLNAALPGVPAHAVAVALDRLTRAGVVRLAHSPIAEREPWRPCWRHCHYKLTDKEDDDA